MFRHVRLFSVPGIAALSAARSSYDTGRKRGRQRRRGDRDGSRLVDSAAERDGDRMSEEGSLERVIRSTGLTDGRDAASGVREILA